MTALFLHLFLASHLITLSTCTREAKQKELHPWRFELELFPRWLPCGHPYRLSHITTNIDKHQYWCLHRSKEVLTNNVCYNCTQILVVISAILKWLQNGLKNKNSPKLFKVNNTWGTNPANLPFAEVLSAGLQSTPVHFFITWTLPVDAKADVCNWLLLVWPYSSCHFQLSKYWSMAV